MAILRSPTQRNPGERPEPVGDEGIASAAPGGYLVFVDTDCAGGPVARVFAVGEDGIEPNTPYRFTGRMTRPQRVNLKERPELDWKEQAHRAHDGSRS